MIKWIKNYIQRKFGISEIKQDMDTAFKQIAEQMQNLSNENKRLRKYIDQNISELQEFTRVDADVGFRGNNTIILTGVFNNTAYVKFYDMGDAPFMNFVEQLKHMRKYALIRHIDAPHTFKGIFNL